MSPRSGISRGVLTAVDEVDEPQLGGAGCGCPFCTTRAEVVRTKSNNVNCAPTPCGCFSNGLSKVPFPLRTFGNLEMRWIYADVKTP